MEHVALLATAKAMKKLPLFVHVERGCLFGVERAEPLPASRAGPLELHVPPSNINDIGPFADVVNFLAWQQRQ
ncbi:MAG: hypothetical protein JXP73_18725 [Deltaproteobacteria bacterium]|nr:hypothetical protein [Deltaproteobacteria bacterium]